MLAPIEIPAHLETRIEEARKLAGLLTERIATAGRREVLEAATDLLERDEAGWVYIEDGFFRFQSDGKLVRFYNPGDLVHAAADPLLPDCSLTCDFGTTVQFFPEEDFQTALAANAETARLWQRFSEHETRIHLVLAGLYMTEEMRPKVKVSSFQPGEEIIEAGTVGDRIYLLVDGEARAIVSGVEVGRIPAGEFFGEIAFLLNQVRNASVEAATPCLVQVIDEANFILMIRERPNMILNIARTLARRISDLNERLKSAQG